MTFVSPQAERLLERAARRQKTPPPEDPGYERLETTRMALGALASSAGEPGAEVIHAPYVEVVEPEFSPGFRTDDLPREICDALKSAHVFLNLFEDPCPGAARSFAFAVMALSRLRGADYEPIPDNQIAELMNVSRETVREKREMFFAWQQKNDLGIIGFRPQERDKATLKYHPNLYRVNMIGYVAEFTRLAGAQWARNPRFAVENAVESGLKQLHEQVSDSIPNAEIVKRAKVRRAEAKTTKQKSAARSSEDRLADEFERFCANFSNDPEGLRSALESAYARLSDIAARYLNGDEI